MTNLTDSQASPKGMCDEASSFINLMPQSEESVSIKVESSEVSDPADMTEENCITEIKKLIEKYSQPVEDGCNHDDGQECEHVD